MKLVAISGSNSSTSINKVLATFAAGLFENADVSVFSMRDFEMPLFGVDLEKEIGQHHAAQKFLDIISDADILVVSLPENNGSYSSAFKNVFDWASRIRKDVFQQKPTLLMATSPGGRGGKSVLELATSNLPRFGMEIKETFSFPLFYQNFNLEENRIVNPELEAELRAKVFSLENAIENVG
ncbi:MAG: NADPH-dependent oxidoreductase [Flavobacterium sp.]|uniref:NADPH-dependent FMN reductase n=1 Tax=Flavobacterium sp. TaxID=239 RepID=UPI0012298C31|nr:NAD(P)H-dependent oxidoreductase [Flavobacterium sp.]RZJ67652.1 MAG: NADPH-dependent oxidoreductase [Flavobacterium sp.]